MQCTAHRPPICFSWYMPMKSFDSFSPSTGWPIDALPIPAPALRSSSFLISPSVWMTIPPRRRSRGAAGTLDEANARCTSVGIITAKAMTRKCMRLDQIGIVVAMQPAQETACNC